MMHETKNILSKAASHAPDWATWVAIDRNGQVWAYESCPLWSEVEGFWFDYVGDRAEYLLLSEVTGDEEALCHI